MENEKCNVYYDLNGGQGSFAVTYQYSYGDTVCVISDIPTKEGYSFAGWQAGESVLYTGGETFTITQHMVFMALWQEYTYQEPITYYTMTFITNGGTYEWVGGGEVISLPTNSWFPFFTPTKVHHAFLYWQDEDGNKYIEGDEYVIGDRDMTFTAYWEELSSHTLTFDLNGGEGDFSSVSIYPDEVYVIPPINPTKYAYGFDHWEDENGNYFYPSSEISINKDTLLTAQWYEIPTGTITFDLNGGTGNFPPITFIFGEWPTIPETLPTKERCEFYGWNNKYGDYFAPGSSYGIPEEQDTLTASWGPEMYIMTFDSDGGYYDYPTITQPAETEFPFFTPTKEGHNFLYWENSKGNTYVEGDWYTVGTEDETFTAHWERYAYVMTYEGIETHDLVNVGESFTVTSTVPAKEGHDFVCWRTGEDTYNAGDLVTPTSDMTFEAVWATRHYTISFDLNGGTGVFAPIDKTYGVDITLPEGTPSREGWQFAHWVSTNGTIYGTNDTYIFNETTILTAVWCYTLTFDLNGGEGNLEGITKNEGESITLSSVPIKTGYTFVQWRDKNNNTYVLDSEYTFNKGVDVLTAEWEEDKEIYTLTYLNDDGTVFATQTKVAGETIKLCEDIPVKSNRYEFYCWYEVESHDQYFAGEEFSKDGNFTFEIVWKRFFFLYFNDHEDYTVAFVRKEDGKNAIIPSTIPEREGYDFVCWCSRARGEYYVPGEIYSRDEETTFDAVWVESTKKMVIYDLDGGTGDFPDQIAEMSESITIHSETPTKEGYVFDCWEDTEHFVDSETSTYSLARTTSSVTKKYYPGSVLLDNYSMRLKAVWFNASIKIINKPLNSILSNSMAMYQLRWITTGTEKLTSISCFSTNTNVAEISNEGRINIKSPGKTIITVTATFSTEFTTFTLFDSFKLLIVDNELINMDLVDYTDMKCTDDGFLMFTRPLSYILNEAGIFVLNEDAEGTKKRNVFNNYDDWYIFGVESETEYVYGMLKMREEENDYLGEESDTDGDATGLTISFVKLEYEKLLNLLESNTTTNSYKLLVNLDSVTGPGTADYDDTIANYFARVSSKAPYLISEEFIQKIANKSCANGVISAPKNYISILNSITEVNALMKNPLLDSNAYLELYKKKVKLSRVPEAIETNNNKAGNDVYNITNNTINIKDPNNLTVCEKYAILMTHTGNVTFNSLAAEVQFHADGLYDWKATVSEYYNRALRADMAIGEEYESGVYDQYYDLESDIVKAQIDAHGEY